MTPVERARSLVGVRFRLQGRDPAVGLDCVGVVINAFELQRAAFPCDYNLRGHALAKVDAVMSRHFRRVSRPAAATGDVLVFRCGPDRLHLGVHGGEHLIQADALIGRVVERPWPAEWPIARAYRRRIRGLR